MSDGTINLQKIFRYSFIVVVVAALAWVVWFVINHSVVEITADNSDITITSESASQVVYATGKGKLTTVLKNGTYIVSAQKNNSIQRSKLVVSPFKITKISLTPHNLLQTKPVTNFQTTSFYPSCFRTQNTNTTKNLQIIASPPRQCRPAPASVESWPDAHF